MLILSKAVTAAVVAAAVGGLTDSVVDHGTGLHVPPKDPAAIAEALATLLASPALRAKLGGAGERRAKARFSWNRIAAETEKAYQLAVAGTADATSLEPMEGAAL